jgi:hypothetical protein
MSKILKPMGIKRRKFLKTAVLGSAATFSGLSYFGSKAAPVGSASTMKIIKIRYYSAPGYNKPLFNQARGIVEIETDGGIIGIGEGGSKDMIEQCAQMMIGEDPFRIERYVLSTGEGEATCIGCIGNGTLGHQRKSLKCSCL